jgi:urea transport system ATP-binding protein
LVFGGSLELGAWNLELFSMLTLSNISVSYDGSRILRGVNITVAERSLVCLMGRNGVGKTTTLKSIVGLTRTDAGSITLDGTELSGLKPDQRARQGLGYVPQGRDIFPHLTVWENLKLSLVVHGAKANGHVDRVLELFPVLKEMLQRKGGVLSGGQQQQLAIARALLTDPKILILDEPTEGIQPSIIDLIGDTLVKIKKEGKISILLVEQYLDFCLSVGDSFYIMDRGAVVAEGPIKHLNDDIVRRHLTV